MLDADKKQLESAQILAGKLRQAASAVAEAQYNYQEIEKECMNTPGLCIQGGFNPSALRPISLTITFGVKL